MENNNPQPAQPTQPAQPVQPTTPATPAPKAESTESNKMVLWFVIGLVVVIFLVGGIYYFLSQQQTTVIPATPTQTSAPVVQENLESDLNEVDVNNNADADFSSVDQDLQQL